MTTMLRPFASSAELLLDDAALIVVMAREVDGIENADAPWNTKSRARQVFFIMGCCELLPLTAWEGLKVFRGARTGDGGCSRCGGG